MMDEHERIYTLMMDMLDGELADRQQTELEVHLRACPACQQEWQALTAVDTLFRQTPAVQPAPDFIQRTMPLLPNWRYRAWTVGVIYVFLLLGGALPLLFGGWLVAVLKPVMSEPGIMDTLWQAIYTALQVGWTTLTALLNGLGEFLIQQPAVLGWLFVMAGIVLLWNGVYQQLITQPRSIG